jgi:hypothetical protein
MDQAQGSKQEADTALHAKGERDERDAKVRTTGGAGWWWAGCMRD